MGKNESIQEQVGDVYVHQDDMHVSAGKWVTGTYVSGTTTAFTGTSAFTVLQCFIKATAAGVVTVGGTATATSILSLEAATGDFCNNWAHSTAETYGNDKSGANTSIVEFAAGESVVISAGNSAAGKYFIYFITTPS